MQTSDVELQAKTQKFKAPTFGYRAGPDGTIEKDVFEGTAPKGWVDSPAKVNVKKAKKTAKAKAPEASADPPAEDPDAGNSEAQEGPGDDALEPPYDQYGYPALRKEYKRRTGDGLKPGTTTTDLHELLDGLDAAA